MSLVVATPVGGADVWAAPVTSGYSEHLRQLSKEMDISHVVEFSDDVVRARNRAAGLILENFPDMTHVLWWDADQWPEDNRVVRSMIDSGVDLVGAPYTSKSPPVRWVHQSLMPWADVSGGLLRVRSVGFGFTMTSRRCLQKMWDACRPYRDWPHEMRLRDMFGMLYDKVEPGMPDGEDMLLSEDRSFCKRWSDMGEHVFLQIDAGIIQHAGCRGWSARDMTR